MSHTNPVKDRSPRGMRSSTAHLANLSVVITATDDLSTLERAVASIRRRCDQFEAEIVVLCTAQTPIAGSLLEQNQRLRIVVAPADASERDLRGLAMREASGDIVAIRAADKVGDARWLDAFCRSITGSDASVLDADDLWETVLADPSEIVIADRSRRAGSSRTAATLSNKLLAPEIGDPAVMAREVLARDRRSGEQTSVSREI